MIWIARLTLAFIAFGWFWAFVKGIRAYRSQKWVLSPTAPSAPKGIPVSIIIPARNEERGIGYCLNSAAAQDHENLQIVVMNDASIDRTGEIIEQCAELDLRIVSLNGDGSPLPEGWFGKPWALQRAQSHATGDWLLFIDADVTLAPEAVSRTLQYARENRLDMVTGLGHLVTQTVWEKILQPVIGGLILAGNSLSSVNNPQKTDKNLANGQFILISREAYDIVGRHAAVKNNILDDVGLARALVAHGKTYHCLFMDDLFDCRMYTSFSEIWEGWTKNMFAGLRYSISNVILAVLFTFAFSVMGHLLFVLGAFQLVSIEMMLWGTAIMCFCQFTRMLMDYRRGLNMIYGLTHSFANILVIMILINSTIRSLRGTVTWKGRVYKPTN